MALFQLGSVGPQVRALEQRLAQLGYLDATPNNRFGAKTADAVMEFKRDHGWDDPKPVAGERLANALNVGDDFEVEKKRKPLKGGTYNCLVGRSPAVVKDAVRDFMKNRNLDFLQLQEMTQYRKVLNEIPGYKLITFPGSRDHGETGILVRDGIKVSDRESIQSVGDWKSKDGEVRRARAATSVLLDGWLRVVSVHAPPAIDFRNGHAVGPEARVASYKNLMRKLERAAERYTRNGEDIVMGGDWNEGPNSTGVGSPHWLARMAGMKTHKGGHIDWQMTRGVRLTNMQAGPSRGSDHRLWTFVIKP